MHLLLVEDDVTLSDLFRAQLQRLSDHTVATAATKEQAITAFEKEAFDLVFIDMGLEGIQERGLEILGELRVRVPEQRAGILSSNDQGSMVSASQEAGAEFYMVKPFSFRGLRVVLEGDKEAIRYYQHDASTEGRIIALN